MKFSLKKKANTEALTLKLLVKFLVGRIVVVVVYVVPAAEAAKMQSASVVAGLLGARWSVRLSSFSSHAFLRLAI